MKFVSIMGYGFKFAFALNEMFENSSMVISITRSYHF